MCLGIPGQILEITGASAFERMARVRFGGITKEINIAFTPEAVVGSYVIVHVGFAISVLNEHEAMRILEDET